MDEIAHRVLRFDCFALDLTRGCLRTGDQNIDLRPKAFKVLRHLAENAGRLVPKEELYEAVWPNVVVSDDSLVQCIRELRQKLGDVEHRLIKTVSRRGYLLDVPILAAAMSETRVPEVTTSAAGKFAPSADRVPKDVAEKLDPDVPVGERKHVTVLCADIKECLELVAQRDPEEALKIFDVVIKLMTEAVHRYGGTMNVVTGDGVIALFGVPLTHEDHAVRACYAALRIQDVVKRYAQELQHAPDVRILVRAGLNSGDVVIRSIAGDLHTEYRAMGRTTHLAARLGQIAAAGTLLVSAETLRLAEGHVQVKALQPVNVTGPGEAVYELVGAGPALTRFQALAARGMTSFVGRSAEMEHLERVHARAQWGHGQVVTIIGEPGLGKSRLLHEFVRSYHASDWLVLGAASVVRQSGGAGGRALQ